MKSYLWVSLSFICSVKICHCCDLAPINQENLSVKVLWSYTPDPNSSFSKTTSDLIKSVCDNFTNFGKAMTLELIIFSYVHEKNGAIECDPTKSCDNDLWEACGEITAGIVAFACCTDPYDTCVQKLKADNGKIDECFNKGLNGPGGQHLLANRKFIDKSGVQEPPEAAVIFNDQYNQCTTQEAQKDFVGTACALYKPEIAPAKACSP